MSDLKKACLIDISRFRVPKLSRMKEMLKKIRSSGYDQIFFNIEHTFKIERHPLIGSEADGFTETEFRDMDEYALAIGLELIPLFQSFGHMFHILKWPQYNKMSETSLDWSLAVTEESVYDFLTDYYQALVRAFRSPYIHIGGDEVYDLAQGKSKSLLQNGSTKNEIFLSHVLRIKKIVNNLDREIMIWGDMIEKDPAILDKLGEEIIICYWNYDQNPLPPIYQQMKNKIYLCPGISTWKSFFIRTRHAQANWQLMRTNIEKLNAYGYMITDWGDGGHPHPLSFTEVLFAWAGLFFSDQIKKIPPPENQLLNQIILKLDQLHHDCYLNGKVSEHGSEFVTRLLFYELVWQGNIYCQQTEAALQQLLTHIQELKTMLTSEMQFKSQFEKDLLLYVQKTFLLGQKVQLHLAYRNNATIEDLEKQTTQLVLDLRKWFARFMENWNQTCQPMGLFFQIHFYKNLEIDLLNALNERISLGNSYDFEKIEKKSVFDNKDYVNLFTVADFQGLHHLWKDYRL